MFVWLPCKAHDAHMFNLIIIFYKWSSENRFFFNQAFAWLEIT